jgi:hypothetical protein
MMEEIEKESYREESRKMRSERGIGSVVRRWNAKSTSDAPPHFLEAQRVLYLFSLKLVLIFGDSDSMCVCLFLLCFFFILP